MNNKQTTIETTLEQRFRKNLVNEHAIMEGDIPLYLDFIKQEIALEVHGNRYQLIKE